MLRSDVFSNGVNYLVLNFDLQGLPQHLWQYLPRYTDAISKLGAGNMNYEQMAQRAAAVTGGLECSPSFSTHALDPSRPVWNMQFRLKALDGKMEDALGVLHDLVFAVNPRDKRRLCDVLNQASTGRISDFYIRLSRCKYFESSCCPRTFTTGASLRNRLRAATTTHE